MVVCVIAPPDAHAGRSIQAEMFPSPPQCFYPGSSSAVWEALLRWYWADLARFLSKNDNIKSILTFISLGGCMIA